MKPRIIFPATEAEFQTIRKLRWKYDFDKCVIAFTVQKKLCRDHLYFHGPGKLGIYYDRKTKQAASRAHIAWEKKLKEDQIDRKRSLIGDYDGIIIFHPAKRGDIPGEFFKQQMRGIALQKALARASRELNE